MRVSGKGPLKQVTRGGAKALLQLLFLMCLSIFRAPAEHRPVQSECTPTATPPSTGPGLPSPLPLATCPSPPAVCVAADKAVSMQQGLCYRLLGPGTCALPLAQRITKQICCCSRVGKAWGSKCETCPLPGTGNLLSPSQHRPPRGFPSSQWPFSPTRT